MILFCRSQYSLRFGMVEPEKLPSLVKAAGYDTMVIADINATTGIYDVFLAAKEVGVKVIVGIEFRNESKHLYTGLACNEEGFRELNELVTVHNISKKPFALVAPTFQNAFAVYPVSNAPKKLRENEFLGIRISELNRFVFAKKEVLSKAVLYHPVTFETIEQYELHKVLRAVENNSLLSKLPVAEFALIDETIIPIDRMLKACEQFPVLITNLNQIIYQSNYEFDFKTPKNKKYFTDSKYNDLLLLESLAMEGLERRYGKDNQEAFRRVKKELRVIDELNFAAYFLITHDIIQYSKSKGHYHVGRGSGANSVVAYVLGITDVCPIELNLFFERFLNPERTSPPDFDIDWSWKNRNDVLFYTFQKFGRERVCFMGAIGTFAHRSHIRELGKVYGLPKGEIDEMTHRNFPVFRQGEITEKILKYSAMLDGMPNLRTMHSCGVLISERPLTYYTALDMPPKGFLTAQFDMYISEQFNLEKLDILSQRGLGSIADAERLIKKRQGKSVDIHNIPKLKTDSVINEKLKRGDTIGCFYIESPAMRGLLRRLKCDNYTTLVAASSIIRPGVAKSGMMREYIERHKGKEFKYPHEIFKEQLEETYGVMVYQEDVIKIAHYFAGLSLAESDIFRRAMSGKTRSKKEFELVKQKFFNNCKDKGYDNEMVNEVYRQIESFAGYSFCKAHSASYAVESYQSLFLKTYYPVEFSIAVINNFGGFYRTQVYIHEAQCKGAEIQLPHVNYSVIETDILGDHVYLGFQHLHNFPTEYSKQIISARSKEGAFKSYDEFVERVPMKPESLKTLIFSGALRDFGKKSDLALKAALMGKQYVPSITPQIFHLPTKHYDFPDLPREPFEDAFDELDLLGFPISCSPFDLLQAKGRGDMVANQLIQNKGKVVKIVAYLVSTKDVPTPQGRMFFGTWIDVNGDYFDTTHFAQSAAQYPFTGGGCYLMLGKIEIDYDFPMINVSRMERLPMVPDPRFGTDSKKQAVIPSTFDVAPGFLTRQPYPSAAERQVRFGS